MNKSSKQQNTKRQLPAKPAPSAAGANQVVQPKNSVKRVPLGSLHSIRSIRDSSQVSGVSRSMMRGFLGLSDADKVYTIQQYLDLGYIQSNTTNQFFAWNVLLNAFANYTVFQSVFDQYCIEEVEITFYPQQNAVGVNTTSLSTYPMLLAATDYDDTTSWTTESQALGYENLHVSPTHTQVSFKWIPHCAIATTSGGIENVPKPWLDTASAAVPHFGLKAALTSGAAAAQYHGFRVFLKAKLAFKNVI